MKTHFRDTRLLVNAGTSFPFCYANARLLDMTKGNLPMTNNWYYVTCKRCLRIGLASDAMKETATKAGFTSARTAKY